MRPFTTRAGLILGALAFTASLASCADAPPQLLIRGLAALDEDCTVNASPDQFLSQGLLDVSLSNGYALFPNVINVAPSSSETGPQNTGGGQQGGGGGQQGASWGDLSGETNRLIVEEAIVSYEFGTEGVPEQVTSAFDTFTIPVAQLSVDPGGSASFQITALDAVHTAALRSVLQPDQQILITVKVRLRGHSTGDQDLETNAFAFPIYVCSGCLANPTCPLGESPIGGTVCLPGQNEVVCTGPTESTDGGTTDGGEPVP